MRNHKKKVGRKPTVNRTVLLRTGYSSTKAAVYKHTTIRAKSQGSFGGEIINELVPNVLCSLKKGHLKHTMTSEIQKDNT